MPSDLSYPGVYIEEVSSGVRTITGVATSVTAFVGFTAKGQPNKAVPITSYADFERQFGGLHRDSPVSYAVRQFYANGGSQALIVRVASGFSTTNWSLLEGTTPVLTVLASSPGTWANRLRITVDRSAARNPDAEFNLIVSELQADGATSVTLETHRNLNMNQHSAQYAVAVVSAASSLVSLTRNGSLIFDISGFAVSGPVSFPLESDNTVIAGVRDGNFPFELPLIGSPWANMGALVSATNNAITEAGLTTALIASESGADGDTGTGHLKLTSATKNETSRVSISGGIFGGLAASIRMGRANGGREFNGDAVRRPVAVSAKAPASSGIDGDRAGPTELMGKPDAKTGMQALLDVDLFNLLSIPETFDMTAAQASAVMATAAALCEARRAFFLADLPSTLKYADLLDATKWPAAFPLTRNGATYFPAPRVADPLDDLRLKGIAPSGTLAGVYARTDSTRGVWKAPAGTDSTMNGVVELSTPLNDLENGKLNLKGINVLRGFPAYGRVVWGARTMRGSDAQADEYKYIPVRRLALFLEESLYRGTQWVVFEPNDEPLWGQIRLNLGAFMQNLFRQGAFQGKSPKEAYFVKCDRETTTQNDINLGIVNIVVGFAPLKPAEFVVIKFQQMAGQIDV
jgi:phage tail sheath protein FI